MNTKIQRIHSKAPTRIDLAGGTVDLWPLYLFLQSPVTINLGIDLFAEATLEISSGTPGVTLRSDDQNAELSLGWAELDAYKAPPALELHLKLLRHFAREKGASVADQKVRLSTRAKSPAGAGLGGSSTLSIAMVGALSTWANGFVPDPLRDGERYIDIVRDVETTVIQVPAGVQDYYGAMFGGLQSLRWGAGRHSRSWLPDELLPELEKRVLLFYSGQSRNSGINNWALYKAFIDKTPGVREKFEGINRATLALEAALGAKDWKAIGGAIAEEWAFRKTLASGITTPEIDAAFAEATKLTGGQIAGKICGAGGGGCFFVYLPEPGPRAKIEEIFVRNGMRALPFNAVPRGLSVTHA